MDKNKTILIIGGSGRIGNRIYTDLHDQDYTRVVITNHREHNLLDFYKQEKAFHDYEPQIVLNCYGKTTNIQLCKDNPASIFRDTIQGNLAVLENCKKYKVEKLVNIVCSCSYPAGVDLLSEDIFMQGEPHASVSSHAYAKRMVYLAGQLYHQQYKLNVITLALNNVFGGLPVIWDKGSSLKFLDSIIKKIVDAKLQKQKKISLWGSGQARREVIYYADAARYVIKAAALYDDNSLLNIGTGIDFTIAEWAEIVSKVVNWKGKVEFDKNKPDGQLVKRFDVTKMRSILGYEFTPVEDAIDLTVDSYLNYLKYKKIEMVTTL